jgi:hypothetical protein
VARLSVSHHCWNRRVFYQKVLFARESGEDTAGSFGVDFSCQRGLTCPDGCSLLRAIPAPLLREPVCVNDGIKPSGKAKSYQYKNWLFE